MAPIPKPGRSPALTSGSLALAQSFPIEFVGSRLSPAITAISTQTQAPSELVAHHILTLAVMAAQRLISIRLPTGAQRPVSCFFATLVGTGEGRGAAEKTVIDTARLCERGFEDDFHKRVAAYTEASVDTSVARPMPLQRLDLFYDPRPPSPDDRYRSYARQSGLFTRHPHDLLQPGRPRRAEAASLCALWNGKVIQRAVGPTLFPRLTLHLVATPRASRALLGESELIESGLLGRMLVAAPASRIGARIFAASDTDEPPPAFAALLRTLGELFEKTPTTDTRVLAFSKDAAAAWFAYAQEIEAAMASGGTLAGIKDFAGYLPEHAARLAAVIAFMNDSALAEITAAHLESGIALARYYTDVRLSMQSASPPELSEDEKGELLRDWLSRTQAEKEITLRDICRIGPKEIRDADTAYKLMRRMERLGIVQPVNTSFQGAAGPRRFGARYTWRLESEAVQSVA